MNNAETSICLHALGVLSSIVDEEAKHAIDALLDIVGGNEEDRENAVYKLLEFITK